MLIDLYRLILRWFALKDSNAYLCLHFLVITTERELLMTESITTTYTVITHYQDDTPHVPKKEMEKDMMNKLQKMGFEPYQIRIMFERFKVGKLMLEIENVQLSTQLNHKASPYEKFLKILIDKYHIDFKNDELANRKKGVKDLQKYVKYLEKNKIKWTYINIYDGETKLKLGSLYHDEPIPKRLIE